MKKVLTFIILLVQVLFANLIIAGASGNSTNLPINLGLPVFESSSLFLPEVIRYPDCCHIFDTLQQDKKQHKRNRRGNKYRRGENPSGDGKNYKNLPKNKPNFPQSNH